MRRAISAGPVAPYQAKSLGTGQGHADRWVRFLIRLGDHRDVVEREMVASVGKLLLGPGLCNDLERFQEAAATLDIRHIVPLVVARQTAPSDPKIEAALTDVVHGCRLFSNAQGIRQGQHLHRQPDAHPPRAGRERTGDDQGRGQHGAFGAKMVLGQPDGVYAKLFGFFYLPEGLIERLCLRHVLAHVEVSKHPKVHRSLLTLIVQSSCLSHLGM